MMLLPVIVGAAALVLPAQPDPNAPMYQDSRRLLWIGNAVHVYAQKHDGQIPPDLASIVPLLPGKDGTTADVIRDQVMAPGIPSKEIPKDAQASWVNENSSYAYLGKANVNLDESAPWSEVAIAHLKLDQGHPPDAGPNDQEHQLFTVVFLDGHVALMPRHAAMAVTEQSRALIDAMSTGGPLPEQFQLVSDLRAVGAAILAYTKANGGDLPPDLGATLPYVKETKRTKTPAQRAAVFLSPRVRANLHVPEAPTADWVNRNTSFVYLGCGGVKLSAVEDPQRTLLVHIRPEDACPPPAEVMGEFPEVTAWTNVERANRAYYDWVIPYSKKVIEFARTGAPLPDLAHAMRDLRLIHKAIEGYAKEHDGMLPADLGQTIEYLPKEEFEKASAQEKARVYLSPRDERVNPPPENADAAWVAAHTSYRYYGDPQVSVKDLRERVGFTLVHAPPGEDITMMSYNFEETIHVVPAANSFGGVWPFNAERFQEQIDQAKEQVRKIKAHEKDE
jgi:hypothetical protein